MLLPNHCEELLGGDKFDLAPLGKPPGFISESARCYDETTNGPLRRHHSIQFAYSRNADLSRLPLFALDYVPVVTLSDNQVDATIRAASASFFNPETALPEKLADQQLKLMPRHSFESAIASSDAGVQRFAFAPGEDGNQRSRKECNRQDVLPKHRKRLQELFTD